MHYQEGIASWVAVRREMAHRAVGRSNPSDLPRGGGIFWGLGLHPLYRHCVETKADAQALELELAARFYRALYG